MTAADPSPIDPFTAADRSAALADLADIARRQGLADGADDYDYDYDPWG